jgi:hypothetical protein
LVKLFDFEIGHVQIRKAQTRRIGQSKPYSPNKNPLVI